MEKLWLSNYEQSINAEIDITRYKSITNVFNQNARKFGDRPVFYNMGKTLAYAETAKLITDFASYLQNILKLPRGGRTTIMMPSLLQYPVTLFGTLQAGMVVANTSPFYIPHELEHRLKDSGTTTIVVLESFADTLELVLPRIQIKCAIVVSVGDMFGIIRDTLMNFMLRKTKKAVSEYRAPGAVPFQTAMKQEATLPFAKVDITREDTIFLRYAGGTTGVAKGAVLSHDNICANMPQTKKWIKNQLREGKETVIAALPFYHILTLTVNLVILTNAGSEIILITSLRDMKGSIGELKGEHISVFVGVSTLFSGMVNQPDFVTVDFSDPWLVFGSGMTTQKAIAEKWKDITGAPIVEVYGLTETSPGMYCSPLSIEAYSGSIGLSIPSTEIGLHGADGSAAARGQPGKLWIKGSQVMQGYWNRLEKTAKAIDVRGFSEASDVAVMDEKGWFRLTDCEKDLIVVSGFSVYLNGIGEAIAHSDKVVEVACVGVSNEKIGEALKIFVAEKGPPLTKEEFTASYYTELVGYKVPKDIGFRDEPPKPDVGKILCRKLREQALGK